jgi:hypothetical protein
MVTMVLVRRIAILPSLAMLLLASCESPDERLAAYAQRASDEQARQNHRMAQQSEATTRQNQELIAAAHKLVEQDAAARRELIQAQDSFRRESYDDRKELDRQRAALEADRSAAAKAAVRAPVIAQALISGGLVLAALLPLLVTAYALKRLPEQQVGHELFGGAMLELLVLDFPNTSALSNAPPSDSCPRCLEVTLGNPSAEA